MQKKPGDALERVQYKVIRRSRIAKLEEDLVAAGEQGYSIAGVATVEDAPRSFVVVLQRPEALELSCAGQAEGTPCWKELNSHPGCRLWDNHYFKDHTVTWTGECAGGLASGTGTLTWIRGGEEQKHSGMLQDGKRHGPWVDAEGCTIRYVNGLP